MVVSISVEIVNGLVVVTVVVYMDVVVVVIVDTGPVKEHPLVVISPPFLTFLKYIVKVKACFSIFVETFLSRVLQFIIITKSADFERCCYSFVVPST